MQVSAQCLFEVKKLNTKETDNKYIAHTYKRYDLCIEKGKGSILFDDKGKKYIDFGSGIAVNTFGVCDETWQNAVKDQLSKIAHTSNYYYTKPCADLAKLICEKTGMKKVFFSNSGAEANECAIKCARKYGTDKNERKNVIITLKNSFHGRTVTTLSATGQNVFHKNITPFTEGFVYVEANNVNELKNAVNENVCAVMIEVIQGEGGVNVLSDEFLAEIEKITTENDILLITDEVQTGNGRCANYCAYQNHNLTPDIVTTAKGLGGGLPIGATMFNEKTENVLSYGNHGSTFGGNPVACAGAISIFSRLNEKLFKRIKEKSSYIKDYLLKIKGVKDVFGEGFMIGVKTDKNASQIAAKCLENGLLILTAKENLRMLLPLNITYDEINEGLNILKGVIENETFA